MTEIEKNKSRHSRSGSLWIISHQLELVPRRDFTSYIAYKTNFGDKSPQYQFLLHLRCRNSVFNTSLPPSRGTPIHATHFQNQKREPRVSSPTL